MPRQAIVKLVPDTDGKWTASVQGSPAPGMAAALRALADRLERSMSKS